MKRIAAFVFAFLTVWYLQATDADAQFRRECRYGFCGGSVASSTPISNACSTSSGTTITFTAQGVGGPNPRRISVVSINWSDSTAAGTAQITGVTIGGIAMTRAVRVTAGVANSNSEIWFVANPTGTTANVVITAATAINGVTIGVYSLIGYQAVVASTTGTTSVSQNYTNKQLAIAAGSRTVNVSTSLSNMVNDYSSACGASLWGVHASQRLNGNGTLTSAISPTSSTPKIALAIWSTQPIVLPVTNTILWWDVSVLSSMTFAALTVTAIADQSGHGNNGTSTNTSFPNPPDYNATGLNSRPTLEFPSNSQSLVNSPFAFGTGSTLTCWVVGQFPVTAHAYGRFISYAAAGQALDFDNIPSFFLGRNNATDGVVIGRNNSFTASSISVGYDTPKVIIATITAGGVQTIYVNGTAGTATVTGGAFGTNGIFSIANTGYGGGSGQGDLRGKISELGCATDAINSTQVGVLNTNLRAKWGL